MIKNQSDKLKQHSLVCGFPSKVVGVNNVKCPFCESVVTHRAIYKHLPTFHYSEKDNEVYKEIMERLADKKKICTECGKVFERSQGYYHHLRTEHPSLVRNDHNYFCQTCGNGFTTLPDLKRHENVRHNDIEEALCVECDKVFKSKKKYKVHLKAFHGDDGGNCTFCQKPFKSLKLLERHVRCVHINDRKYKCDQCPKAFNEGERLKKHINNIHVSLKPYCCEKCTYKTDNPFNLNLHRSKMHQATDKITRLKLIEMINNGQHPYCGKEYLLLLQKPIDTY